MADFSVPGPPDRDVPDRPADAHGRRALVVGVGLIGGSIGAALRRAGWHVVGRDRDQAGAPAGRSSSASSTRSRRADGPVDAELTFVATPVGAIADEVRRALADTTGLVTDVGSVKAPLLALMADPRYVGGHPMAGTEQEGVDGARADLFEGAPGCSRPSRAPTTTPSPPCARSWPASAPRSCRSRPSATTRWSPWSPTCPTSPRPASWASPTSAPPSTAACCAWPPAASAT